jgi:hypothetical protein
LGKIIAKVANLGSKKTGLSLDHWENCMILKKISIGKRPFIGVCYRSRKITVAIAEVQCKDCRKDFMINHNETQK